jgi:3-dehydroquinate synthase
MMANSKLIPKNQENIFLYGPPGSGKSSTGPVVANSLSLPFIDLDQYIEARIGKPIPAIFHEEGELGFRAREREAFADCLKMGSSVIALGGGALLDPEMRDQAEETGNVICLNTDYEVLLHRLENSLGTRPLISDPEKTQGLMLLELLENRKEHYASFKNQINTTQISIDESALKVQILSGWFRIRGMGSEYDVKVKTDSLQQVGKTISRRLPNGSVAIVCDRIVAQWYLEPVLESLLAEHFRVDAFLIPPGEKYKTIDTMSDLWNFFLKTGIDRSGTIIALGGGVVNDLAGFAAATYMRGVKWVAIPTTLLAMVDASLGGKTGVDLAAGKNLIGAFHAPSLVVADPSVLRTLSEEEFTSGLAEVIKHGIIADPELFTICHIGGEAIRENIEQIVKRAMAVKIRIIQEDPYEKGRRAVLNLGHTLGHAIEKVTHFQVRHGEAVAIGMVAAAKVSEHRGIGESGISEAIKNVLVQNHLPTVIPGELKKETLLEVMLLDKKRAVGTPRLVLPKRIGDVIWGYELNDFRLMTDL